MPNLVNGEVLVYCQMSWNPENCVIHVLWINLFVLGVHFLGLHLVLTLTDKCLSKVAVTLHGVLKFPWAPWDRSKVWYFSWRWLCHGVLIRFPRRSHSNLGVSTKLHGVPTAFQLAITCALTAVPLRAWSCHGMHCAFTELSLRWRLLFTFFTI